MSSEKFNPANFHGIAACGPLIVCGNVDVQIALHVTGDGSAMFSLAMGRKGKEIIAFLGAAEWPQLQKAVKLAEAYYACLREAGKCDEITPVPWAG